MEMDTTTQVRPAPVSGFPVMEDDFADRMIGKEQARPLNPPQFHERNEFQSANQMDNNNADLMDQQWPELDAANPHPTLVQDVPLVPIPAQQQMPMEGGDEFRDRMDSTFSNDSLLQLNPEELAQREREIFGEHYWQQQQQNQQFQQQQPTQSQLMGNLQQSSFIGEQNFDQMPPEEIRAAGLDPRVPSFIPQNPPLEEGQSPVLPNHRPIFHHFGDLIMWRNVKDSAVIFSFGGFLLFSLAYFSFISVLSYMALSILLLATGLVFARQLQYTLQQREGGPHPFERLLARDVVIPPAYAHQQLDAILAPLNASLVRMRNLFLADSLGQSLKLALAIYLTTYLGQWFNLLTLAMIMWAGVFTLPKLYTMNRPAIDRGVRIVRGNVRRLRGWIRERMPWERRRLAAVKEELVAEVSPAVQSVKKVEKKVVIKQKKNL